MDETTNLQRVEALISRAEAAAAGLVAEGMDRASVEATNLIVSAGLRQTAILLDSEDDFVDVIIKLEHALGSLLASVARTLFCGPPEISEKQSRKMANHFIKNATIRAHQALDGNLDLHLSTEDPQN